MAKTRITSYSFRWVLSKLLMILFSALSLRLCDAFAVGNNNKRTVLNKATELPRYDSQLQQWVPTGPNQLPEAGYPPTKTLLLQGPKPFLTRILQKDDYEQAVLKFMAGDKVTSRDVAQGNMDAYLRNPQDWMYSRMESQRKGYEINYTTISPKDVALVTIWSGVVGLVVVRVIFSLGTGENFWAFFSFSSIKKTMIWSSCWNM
jgi:hypothetical protein